MWAYDATLCSIRQQRESPVKVDSVLYLGNQVMSKGLKSDETKIKAVMEMPLQ